MNTNKVRAYAADGVTQPGEPSVLCQGGKVPLRVLVRNLGDPTANEFIVLSYDAATLSNPGSGGAAPAPPGGNTYHLPGGQSDAFIVMPGESIYAVSLSGAGFVMCSWAVSEALPHDFDA